MSTRKHSLIYSKKGDTGYTRTVLGRNVRKNDITIQLYGEIDFVLAQFDKTVALLSSNPLVDKLLPFRKTIASLFETATTRKVILGNELEELEQFIDDADINLTGFIIFKDLVALEINELRVRVRRLERLFVSADIFNNSLKFINRFSDFLFVLAYLCENNR